MFWRTPKLEAPALVGDHGIEIENNSFRPRNGTAAEVRAVENNALSEAPDKCSRSSAESLRKLSRNNTKKDASNEPKKESAAPAKAPEPDAEPEPKPEPKPQQPSSSWYSWKWTRRPEPQTPSDKDGEVAKDTPTAKDVNTPEFDQERNGGGGWAFWSKSSKSSPVEAGELAIDGTDTERHPRPAEVSTPAPSKKQKTAPNLVVPAFNSVYDWPGSARILSSSLAKLGLVHNTKVFRTSPSRIRKAVVIGVHGYFPARMTRAILGEPTGTSIKFMDEAATALDAWAKAHGEEVSIEKIALEGEGRVNHRVQTLYNLLLNWLSSLREADFVVFAVHSQGAVVTVHLLSKLIEEKILKSKQRIGILSMAGVCLGPMPGMDQKMLMKAVTAIEHDSLTELFQLQRPDSSLAIQFRKDFAAVLKFGVKTVLLGSVDDQLVPLYSALCTNITHPNIFRAAYLDGVDVTPEVIAPLLDLALKRLDNGESDFGVIIELSSALTGALTGKGHSKLYSAQEVYGLGMRVFLESSTSTGVDAIVDHDFGIPKENPYLLPWSMHSLLSRSTSNPKLTKSVETLLEEYRSWKPTTKAMKTLKYRLAGLKQAKL